MKLGGAPSFLSRRWERALAALALALALAGAAVAQTPAPALPVPQLDFYFADQRTWPSDLSTAYGANLVGGTPKQGSEFVVAPGATVTFSLTAYYSVAAPVAVGVSQGALPAGAALTYTEHVDSKATAKFEWTPVHGQEAEYELCFGATSGAAKASTVNTGTASDAAQSVDERCYTVRI